MIIQGDAQEVLKRMDDESIHCAVTSSPYYGLRSYGTEPLIWDGDPSCQHEWGKVHPPGYRSSDTKPGPLQSEGNTNRQNLKSDICVKCGAWKGELGQEPTPELFVKHITTICHELKRVLRSDGTFWYNIGDSYAANRGYQVPDNIWCDVGNSRGSKVPTGCKPKDLIGIPWMIAFALRADGWYLRADLPWIKRNCLGSGTTIYTRSQKGIMPQTIHDLTRNNSKLIELWNGNKWTRLIDIHKTEEISDGIEIEFRSGEKITCTKEHRWPTNRGIIASSEFRKHRAKCKSCCLIQTLEWQKLNKDKMKLAQRKHHANNLEKRREVLKKNASRYYKLNKSKSMANSALRKAKKLQRMPSWLTKEQKKQITDMYRKCPKGYHVDHIIPLCGKTVSGLHVPWNLQYLSAYENLKKSNSFTGIIKSLIP